MKIDTSVCGNAANSYVTIEEFEEYISNRDGFATDDWLALSIPQKTIRLIYGAYVIDSLKFIGKKACRGQALQFPRITPADSLFTSGEPFSDYETLEEFCALLGVDIPAIPDKVKIAQIEATFQIVHSHLFNIDVFDEGEAGIASLSIDAISLSFSKGVKSAYNLFQKSDFGAASTIKLLLQDYLVTMRGELV